MIYRIQSLLLLPVVVLAMMPATAQKPRAREAGIPFDGIPGRFNAITDVPGVTVGHTTIISGSGKLKKGEGPVRTGVTAILPGGKNFTPVFANWHMLNGNGDMTGTHWITESGFLETPILITNTGSVGIVRDAALAWMDKNHYYNAESDSVWYAYPVVAETYDGVLNDMNGFHVTREHVWQALDSAKSGIPAEGNVGGGTGMICLGFKGGSGTSSRVIDKEYGGYHVGVIVQSNFGKRSQLTIAGIPVGKELADTLPIVFNSVVSNRPGGDANTELGSIIAIVATDAPLLPQQLKRIAQRVSLGIGKMGGIGGNGSGDIFLAFSTANKNAFNRQQEETIKIFPNDNMGVLFEATIQATEEAILNAMVAAETMEGINGNKAYALPVKCVIEILRQHKRLPAKK